MSAVPSPAPAPPAAPSADPSAALVDRIASEALNPSYRTRPDRPGVPRRSPWLTLIVVGFVGVLVGVLVVASRSSVASVDSERASLLELANERGEEVTALQERVAALQADVRTLREAALSSESIGSAQARRIDELGIAAGTQPVLGPGAVVTVADAEQSGGEDDAASRVLDIDLQQVVNGLWEAGAEVVSVNGQRVGALTAIRSVQETILVNYEPVVGPYVVRAVGDPRTLPTDFLRSSGGQWLQAVNLSAGLRFSIDSSTDDQRFAGDPVGALRHATPLPDLGEGEAQ
jgi:uncharacterized protein YlxW (UPF0749 family)